MTDPSLLIALGYLYASRLCYQNRGRASIRNYIQVLQQVIDYQDFTNATQARRLGRGQLGRSLANKHTKDTDRNPNSRTRNT